MIASAHVASGFVAGMISSRVTSSRTGRVVAAFVFGLLMHVVLDAVPHSDYRQLAPSTVVWVTLAEGIGVCLIAGEILRDRVQAGWPEYLLGGLAGAVILDAKFFARVVLSQHAALTVAKYGDAIHKLFHADPARPPQRGTVVEIATTILLLFSLAMFSRTRGSRAT